MKTSKEELLKKARETKFRPEILEKVWWLLELLEELNEHPVLENRIALKGGTALNLFYFDFPRLSVDIDLNFIGSVSLPELLLERPKIEKAFEAVMAKIGLSILRIPKKHAGGKWQLKYPSFLGGLGNLEVDVNFMFRLPIHDTNKKDSRMVGERQAKNILLINYQEIAAGKLTALFARSTSRDLFDTYHLLADQTLDLDQTRLVLCVYGAMSSVDWRTISHTQIAFEEDDLIQKLLPVLRTDVSRKWAQNASDFIEQCRKKLAFFFPFSDQEMRFFDLLYEEGKIDASLLTNDPNMIEKIQNQPLLQWKSKLILQKS